jgi:hypothetical protein
MSRKIKEKSGDVFLRHPIWKDIYNDARFKNLLQRIGLEN